MEMNTYIDLATFYAAKLNTTELAKLHELVTDALDARFESHSDQIREAIEAAINDGMEIEIWADNGGEIKIPSMKNFHIFMSAKR